MKSNRVKNAWRSFFVLFAFVLGALASTQPADAQTVSITGRLLSPDGTAKVSNAAVYVRNASWTLNQSYNTGSDGVFKFYDLAEGTYYIKIYKPWNWDAASSPPLEFSTTVTSDQTTDLKDIKFKIDNVKAKLTNSSGQTFSSHYVYIYNSNNLAESYYDYTDSSGELSFYIPNAGSYYAQTYDSEYNNFFAPSNKNFTLSTAEESYDIGTMTGMTPNVTGKFVDPNGSVIGSPYYPYGFVSKTDYTLTKYFNVNSTTGIFRAYVPAGSYNFTIYGGNSKPDPDPRSITVPATGTLDMGTIQQPTQNVKFTLLEKDGVTAVRNASVSLHNTAWTINKTGTTNSSGIVEFSLSTPATYYADFYAYHASQSDPAQVTINWNTGDTINQTVLLRNPSVHGKITNSSGIALANASVSVYSSNYNYYGYGSTNQNGEFYVKALPTGTYTMQVYPPYSSDGNNYVAPDPISISLTEGTTNETYYNAPIQLALPTKTISGKVQTSSGKVITDAYVSGYRDDGGAGYFSTSTDSSGNFTMKTGKGRWKISIWRQRVNGQSPSWAYSESPKTVDFKQDNSVTESESITFTVRSFTSKIKGSIRKPDGTLLTNTSYMSVGVTDNAGFWNSTSTNNGDFEVLVPNGTFSTSVYISDTTYSVPELTTVTLNDNETYDFGEIRLNEKNEYINVTIKDTNDKVLSGQYVYAWKQGKSWEWASGTTDSTGKIQLRVSTGDWTVQAMPSYWYNQSSEQYAMVDEPQKVTLTTKQTADLTIRFGIANSTLKVTVKDTSGNVVKQNGWLSVASTGNSYYSGLGAQIVDGAVEVKVPKGTWRLDPWFWNTEYDLQESLTVTVGDSETKDNLSFTVIPTNATIVGSVVDSSGNKITDLSISIFAKRDNVYKYYWSSNGDYNFKLSAGTWQIGAYAGWGTDYLVDPSLDSEVTVAANESKTFNISLVKKDATLTGTVKDSDGNILNNVYISLQTKLGEKSTTSYSTWGNQNEFSAFSDQYGRYTLKAPRGEYWLTASTSLDKGLIPPEAQKVTLTSNTTTTVDLEFKQPDATISGTVELNDQNSTAFVYAYSDQNGYTETTTENGEFELDISSGETWSVGATYQKDETTYYQSGEVKIIADEKDTSYNADLVLEQVNTTLPAAETITFESDETATLNMTDGTQVIMPAGSILADADELITVTATPEPETPRVATDRPVSYGLELTAVHADDGDDNVGEEISSFNSQVTVVVPYEEGELEEIDVEESELSAKYWDETAGQYRQVENIVIDEDANTLSYTTKHFTLFNLTSGGTVSATAVKPAVTLTLPPDGAVVTVPQVVVSGTVSDASATVSITLNGTTKPRPTLASDGPFETTIAGLTLGSNTISVTAANTAGTSAAVNRTVTFSVGGDGGSGGSGGSDDQEEITADDTPSTLATAVVKDIVTIPNDGKSHVRVFDQAGTLKTSFFAYHPDLSGRDYQVITRDLDGDGSEEILTSLPKGFTSQIRVFKKDGTLLTHFFGFDPALRVGAKMYLSDLTGDGLAELLVTPSGTGGGHLRVFTFNTTNKTFSFYTQTFLYDQGFRGGVDLVLADITGNGVTDVIAAPSTKANAHVRVFEFTNNTWTLKAQGFPYNANAKLGVKILTGDMDGDGVREMIVAPKTKASSNIRVLKYDNTTQSLRLLDHVMAFGEQWKGELNIRVADLNDDGRVEIVTAPHQPGGPNMRVYTYNVLTQELELLDWWMPYQSTFDGGVDFVITTLNGNDYPEIVTTPRHKGGSILRVYEYDPATRKFKLLDWMQTHNDNFRGQLTVTVADLEGNGDSELVVAPLESGKGGPNVRVVNFNNGQLELSKWFMAYAATFRGGVKMTTINQ